MIDELLGPLGSLLERGRFRAQVFDGPPCIASPAAGHLQGVSKRFRARREVGQLACVPRMLFDLSQVARYFFLIVRKLALHGLDLALKVFDRFAHLPNARCSLEESNLGSLQPSSLVLVMIKRLLELLKIELHPPGNEFGDLQVPGGNLVSGGKLKKLDVVRSVPVDLAEDEKILWGRAFPFRHGGRTNGELDLDAHRLRAPSNQAGNR